MSHSLVIIYKVIENATPEDIKIATQMQLREMQSILSQNIENRRILSSAMVTI